MLSCHKSYQSEYWTICTDLSAKHIFNLFISWQQLSLGMVKDACGREKCRINNV